MKIHGLVSRRISTITLSLVAGAVVATLVAVSMIAAPPRTKGVIPDNAFREGAGIDYSIVPDYVSVVGRDGAVVGYVSKIDLANQSGPNGEAAPRTVPVFGDDLSTLVGHMVPNKGFIAIDADAATVRDFEAVSEPGDGDAH